MSLRTEVAALRMARDDLKLERDLARQNFCDEQAANYQLQAHLKACLGELSELRARVVVPERKLLNAGVPGLNRNSGWNACLDELARINGMTVSEGLLRRLVDFAAAHPSGKGLAAEVGALLSEQEEEAVKLTKKQRAELREKFEGGAHIAASTFQSDGMPTTTKPFSVE